MLSAKMLECMRSIQSDSLADTCELWLLTDGTPDAYGKPAPLWVMDGRSACGLELVTSREYLNAEAGIYDARLRLPIDVDISRIDRVKITHRHGEIVNTPLEYDLIGEPRRGPSGLVVNLRSVT